MTPHTLSTYGTPIKRESETMKVTKAYIYENLNHPITIPEIAAVTHQSESSLKRKFKATYDCGIGEFIQFARIQQAKKLFMTSDCKIAEVAYTVGYANPSHFSKVFCKYIGCNPKAFLKSNVVNKE